MFEQYIGIDYSGAKTAQTALEGISVFCAVRKGAPQKKRATGTGKDALWSREELAHWIIEVLGKSPRTLIGIDHAFSFPNAYMIRNNINEWDDFLDDLEDKWPACQRVESLLHRLREPHGYTREFRITEQWARSMGCPAKSVFAFKERGKPMRGTVAYSTHAGLPWLRMIRSKLGNQVHFWPFDGFDAPEGKSVIAEVYPTVFLKGGCSAPRNFNKHERDAYVTCRWLQHHDRDGSLERHFHPELKPEEEATVKLEGWILGVE